MRISQKVNVYGNTLRTETFRKQKKAFLKRKAFKYYRHRSEMRPLWDSFIERAKEIRILRQLPARS